MNLYDLLMSNNKNLLNSIIEKRNTYITENPGPMIWDDDIIRKVAPETVRKYGYRVSDGTCCPYSAVLYKSNKVITVINVSGQDAVISFGFTGCSLVKFAYKGELYAAHIPPEQARNWEQLCRNANIQEYKRFAPHLQGYDENKLKGKYPSDRCWGLIDTNDEMYSLIVFENITYEFDSHTNKYVYKQAGDSCLKKSGRESGSCLII